MYNNFLQQLSFNSDIVKKSELLKVEVDEIRKILYFNIKFSEVLSIDEFSSFIEEFSIFFNSLNIDSKFELRITYDSFENFKNYHDNYLDYIINNLEKTKTSISIIKNYEKIFAKNIFTFTITKDFVKQFLDIAEEIVQKFKNIGLDIKLEYIINADIEMIDVINKQNDIKHEQLTKIADTIDEKKKLETSKKTNTSNYRSARNYTNSNISDIPLDQYTLDKYKNEKGPLNFKIEGRIINFEVRQIREYNLLTMTITDDLDAIVCKKFLNKKEVEDSKLLQIDSYIRIQGKAEYDAYLKDVCIMITKYDLIDAPTQQSVRKDNAKTKRVEFHIHTKMTNMDATNSETEFIERAILWGHEAIAITDTNGLYALPKVYSATKSKKIKPIYGALFTVVDDESYFIAKGKSDKLLKDLEYTVFDLETTGLSMTRDKIIEIGAVRIKNGQIINTFQEFVNPGIEISQFTTDLTSITNNDVENADSIDIVLPKFLEFIKDSVLVAHNAHFDIGHIEKNIKDLNLDHQQITYIDTLNLARSYYSDKLNRFNLKALTKYFKIDLKGHHRAINDAQATAEIFIIMLSDMYSKQILKLDDLNKNIVQEDKFKHIFPFDLSIICQNEIGYRNLFKLTTQALTTYFYKTPRLAKSIISKYRNGIFVGSSTYKGEIFESALNETDDVLIEKIKYYDYIEVHPLSSYRHFEDILGNDWENIIKNIIIKIINYSKQLNKIVIATSNAHYLDKTDSIYRSICIRTPIVGGGFNDLSKYKNQPLEYFLTTNEMLEAFNYLDEKLAYEIVVENTNLLNSKIENIKAFPDELYSLPDDAFNDVLNIKSMTEDFKDKLYNNLYERYGKNPHKLIIDRIEKELDSIISNKFAPIYYIAYLLVKNSLDAGYIVGSRGSVGSSFVATISNITEVNPLPPHYYCPNGCVTIFKIDDNYKQKYKTTDIELQYQKYFENIYSGFDLEDQLCPKCQTMFKKDGHDIPFETFLGFKGDKIPDIDLNFSGEYQSIAHEYVRQLLGVDNAFRAGTISKIAEKNAFGYVKGYLEDNNIVKRKAMIAQIAKKLEGVRRSTGQHPGGIVVVPKNHTIYDVTPIQYPADDTTSSWMTTHFDYHSFESNLLKLDILGHDDPTMVKYLMDFVKENPKDFPFTKAEEIPLDDKDVLKLFNQSNILKINQSEVSSYGLPEFNTPFTREMLKDIGPESFSDLVKVSGFSHGTGVWRNNSSDLLKGIGDSQRVSFSKLIACRDEIMTVLISEYNMDPKMAFDIMEVVRKGKQKANPVKWQEYILEMKKCSVPQWYINSCSKIEYMFPKAHAVAYVIMAVRIAWFKLYKPLLFYSAFLSKRATEFDHEIMVAGEVAISNKLKEYQNMKDIKVKDQNLITTLEVCLEMAQRGYKFLKCDINKSDENNFTIENGSLRMPFKTIAGLGQVAANSVVEYRKLNGDFKSIKEVADNTKLNKTVIQKLKEVEAFDGIPDEIEEIDLPIGLFK